MGHCFGLFRTSLSIDTVWVWKLCCSYKKTLLSNTERYIAWQTQRPVQVSEIPHSLCCFPFLKDVGAPTASACLYLEGLIFGKTGSSPLRSVESHPSVLIGSELGPRGASYNSVMLPRSFICILSCPLFPVICFPSRVWRQIYPSNLQNIFCFSFVKSLVLFLHPLTSFAQKPPLLFLQHISP